MVNADLKNAHLVNANLQRADLTGANLAGANLEGANLENANLVSAVFTTKTLMPDGMAWVPDIDLTRFTDPNHPDFWRSDDPHSPAYRGDGETHGE